MTLADGAVAAVSEAVTPEDGRVSHAGVLRVVAVLLVLLGVTLLLRVLF